MPNPNILALVVSEISAFVQTDGQRDERTDGHGYIDLASDPDQKYMYIL